MLWEGQSANIFIFRGSDSELRISYGIYKKVTRNNKCIFKIVKYKVNTHKNCISIY